MKRTVHQLIHYTLLIAVTVVAATVMWWVSHKHNGADAALGEHANSPLPVVAEPKALAAVEPLGPETCELTSTFAGKIRPWETYSLGFEVAGRVVALGTNENGQPLDDGMRVKAGQVLARLDDRTFLARKSETAAQLEEAASNLQRGRQLREQSPGALTDTEFQELLTATAQAKAQQEIALKDLDDSVLTAPVDATISRRLVNLGESVSQGTIAFELVEDDRVLLVVDVPESHVRELEMRKRAVERNREQADGGADEEDRVFRAYVTLEGRGRFGRRWPPVAGEVYRIAQVADPRTGLFEVEVRVPNDEGLIRPGMVATAQVVTDRLPAYKIPESAVLFRDRRAHVFTIDAETIPMQMMFWDVGTTQVAKARRVELQRWIDQGDDIIVPADAVELSSVVIRGQQRLSDAQWVRIVDDDGAPTVARGDALPAPVQPISEVGQSN